MDNKESLQPGMQVRNTVTGTEATLRTDPENILLLDQHSSCRHVWVNRSINGKTKPFEWLLKHVEVIP